MRNRTVKPNTYAALMPSFSAFDCIERGADTHALHAVLAALRTDDPQRVAKAVDELDALRDQLEALEACLDALADRLADEAAEERSIGGKPLSIARAHLLVMALSDLTVDAAAKVHTAQRLTALKNGGCYEC